VQQVRSSRTSSSRGRYRETLPHGLRSVKKSLKQWLMSVHAATAQGGMVYGALTP
jgi:hypothetical protein